MDNNKLEEFLCSENIYNNEIINDKSFVVNKNIKFNNHNEEYIDSLILKYKPLSDEQINPIKYIYNNYTSYSINSLNKKIKILENILTENNIDYDKDLTNTNNIEFALQYIIETFEAYNNNDKL